MLTDLSKGESLKSSMKRRGTELAKQTVESALKGKGGRKRKPTGTKGSTAKKRKGSTKTKAAPAKKKTTTTTTKKKKQKKESLEIDDYFPFFNWVSGSHLFMILT